MSAQHYRHRTTGAVITVNDGSDLAGIVEASRAYDVVDANTVEAALEAQAAAATTGVPAGSVAARDESPGGWLTPPGVRPAPIAASAGDVPGAGEQPARPDVSPVIAKAYEVDTVEGVNGWLDDHADHVAEVLAYEQAHQARKGILEGRHAPASE